MLRIPSAITGLPHPLVRDIDAAILDLPCSPIDNRSLRQASEYVKEAFFYDGTPGPHTDYLDKRQNTVLLHAAVNMLVQQHRDGIKFDASHCFLFQVLKSVMECSETDGTCTCISERDD